MKYPSNPEYLLSAEKWSGAGHIGPHLTEKGEAHSGHLEFVNSLAELNPSKMKYLPSADRSEVYCRTQ